jgi:hypothetical protein
MINDDELNDLLTSRKSSAKINHDDMDYRAKELKSQELQLVVNDDGMGLTNHFRLMSLRSDKALAAARRVLDTNLELLTHESEARIRESKAFWDAQSVEVAERIKAYAQARIGDVEAEKMDYVQNLIIELAVLTANKIEKIKQMDIPKETAIEMIAAVLDCKDESINRIKTKEIATKYGLD